MARFFEISIHRNEANLHLKLVDDFDEASAHQLLDVLKRYCNHTSRVFLHTGGLGKIYPCGPNVLHKNLDILEGKPLRLVFTGENASQLAPSKTMSFGLAVSTLPTVAAS